MRNWNRRSGRGCGLPCRESTGRHRAKGPPGKALEVVTFSQPVTDPSPGARNSSSAPPHHTHCAASARRCLPRSPGQHFRTRPSSAQGGLRGQGWQVPMTGNSDPLAPRLNNSQPPSCCFQGLQGLHSAWQTAAKGAGLSPPRSALARGPRGSTHQSAAASELLPARSPASSQPPDLCPPHPLGKGSDRQQDAHTEQGRACGLRALLCLSPEGQETQAKPGADAELALHHLTAGRG